MASALLRTTVRMTAAAAGRCSVSTNLLPIATTRILSMSNNDEQRLNVPQLQSSCSYCTAESHPEADLNIADILHGVLHNSLFLIDVREPEEIKETGKIGRAVNIPVSEIEEAFNMSYADFEAKYRVRKPNVMSERVVIYCKTGQRDAAVCETLRKLGYNKVKRYPGGITEWNQVTLGDVADEQTSK